jgi:carboxymethylenebutenolidase
MQRQGKHSSESEGKQKMKTTEIFSNGLTAAQQELRDLWDEHVRNEFATKDADAALATMTPDAYVNHVPVLTGGVGKEELREFYANHFIPKMPADTEIVPISRTIGSERVVDEMIIRFTHTIEIDWMLPGIPATGKRVELPTVAIVQFRDGKLFNEHIYWDQASVLVQLGLLDSTNLPVVGVEVARKVADPTLPSNQIMKRAGNSLASATADGVLPQVKPEWFETRPGEHCLIRVSAQDTDGLYSLVEIVSDPGDGTPMHIHEREDEHVAVLEGTARLAYGDKTFDCRAGEVVTLRKGIPHAWGNRSTAPLRMAFLVSPGGTEKILSLLATFRRKMARSE